MTFQLTMSGYETLCEYWAECGISPKVSMSHTQLIVRTPEDMYQVALAAEWYGLPLEDMFAE